MRPINSVAIVFGSALTLIAGLASGASFDVVTVTSSETAPEMCADQTSLIVAAAEGEQTPSKEQAPSGDVQERAIPRTGPFTKVIPPGKNNIVVDLTENECKKLGCSVSMDSSCPVSNIGIERLRCTCSTGSACIDKGNY